MHNWDPTAPSFKLGDPRMKQAFVSRVGVLSAALMLWVCAVLEMVLSVWVPPDVSWDGSSFMNQNTGVSVYTIQTDKPRPLILGFQRKTLEPLTSGPRLSRVVHLCTQNVLPADFTCFAKCTPYFAPIYLSTQKNCRIFILMNFWVFFTSKFKVLNAEYFLKFWFEEFNTQFGGLLWN